MSAVMMMMLVKSGVYCSSPGCGGDWCFGPTDEPTDSDYIRIQTTHQAPNGAITAAQQNNVLIRQLSTHK